MPQTDDLASALKRLSGAVEKLELSVDAILERESNLQDVEAEVQRMGADRTRLAEALDQSQARSNQLEHVNKEVSRRLVDAMESIRNVIEKRQSAGE